MTLAVDHRFRFVGMWLFPLFFWLSTPAWVLVLSCLALSTWLVTGKVQDNVHAVHSDKQLDCYAQYLSGAQQWDIVSSYFNGSAIQGCKRGKEV